MSNRNLPKKERLALVEGIGTMLTSGIGLYEALGIFQNNRHANSISRSLLEGKTVEESFKSIGVFSSFELDLIRAGEKSGQLLVSMNGILELHKFRQELKQKLISVSLYPLLVLLTAFGTVLFMALFIIPSFEDVFSRSNGELPGFTNLIFQLSHFGISLVQDPFLWFFMLIGLFVAFHYRASLKIQLLNACYGIPMLKKRLQLFIRFSFFSFLSVHLGSGIPFIEALNTSKKFVLIPSLILRIEKCSADLIAGKSIRDSFMKLGILNVSDLALIGAGEESNSLSGVFQSISEKANNDLKREAELLGRLIEPIILLVVGGIVGVILIGLYLPMFQINQVF